MYLIINNSMNRWNEAQKNYFTKQLKDSKKYEKQAAKKVCRRNNDSVDHYCDNYKYDFMTTNTKLRYEVKHGKASVVYGNFFIECGSDGKPSGILTTEADFYIILSNDIFYPIPTDALKELIHDKKYIRTASTNITNKTDGFIFNKNTIIKHSVIL